MLATVVTVLHVLFSLGLITVVLLMSGRSAGLSGSIAGGAEAVFGKRKGLDDILGRFAAGFAMALLVTSLVLTFLKG